MKTDLFIVTFIRDFPYLEYCLKSIRKFATGFNSIRLLLPNEDVGPSDIFKEWGLPLDVIGYEEVPGHGMMGHEYQIMCADTRSDADFIAHIDADCIFTDRVSPETYILDGKPILRYEPFDRIGARWPGVLAWERATRRNLPFPVLYETMRCHPEVYHHGLYSEARKICEQTTKTPIRDYILSQTDQYPHTFCEFVTLGNVAMQVFPEKYTLIEQYDDVTNPPNFLQQFWSHGPIDKPQTIWVKGEQKSVVPIQMITQLGL